MVQVTNVSNKWFKGRMEGMRQKYGGACFNPDCRDIVGLEFCHLEPTEVKGANRGRNKRYYDIKKHLDKYTLLCDDCHRRFDCGTLEYKPVSLKKWGELHGL